jgi:hypothetical protein
MEVRQLPNTGGKGKPCLPLSWAPKGKRTLALATHGVSLAQPEAVCGAVVLERGRVFRHISNDGGGIWGFARSVVSAFGPCTMCPGGTDVIRNTPPLITEPAPMIVSPPRMVAPA